MYVLEISPCSKFVAIFMFFERRRCYLINGSEVRFAIENNKFVLKMAQRYYNSYIWNSVILQKHFGWLSFSMKDGMES